MAWHELEVNRDVDAKSGARIFRLKGALAGSEDSFAFLESVRQTLREKPAGIVINLADVDMVTSTGVGILASCYTSAVNAGNCVALAQLQGKPRSVLKVVNLLAVIPEYESEQAAVEGVNRRRT